MLRRPCLRHPAGDGAHRLVPCLDSHRLINQLDIKLGSKLPGMRLLQGMEEARVLALSRKSAHSIKAITRKLPFSVGVSGGACLGMSNVTSSHGKCRDWQAGHHTVATASLMPPRHAGADQAV